MNAPTVIDARVRIDASARCLHRLYTDLATWSTWDPDTRWARLDGPPEVGVCGWLRPRQGLPVRLRVTVVQPDRRFTVEALVLGSRMCFDHDIEPLPDGGVEVTHRVTFIGWLAPWLARTVGKTVLHGLPHTLARLKAHAEALEAAHPGALDKIDLRPTGQ